MPVGFKVLGDITTGEAHYKATQLGGFSKEWPYKRRSRTFSPSFDQFFVDF